MVKPRLPLILSLSKDPVTQGDAFALRDENFGLCDLEGPVTGPEGRHGAQEKTRTSTALRPQVPETCASTNSATWAPFPAGGDASKNTDPPPARRDSLYSARGVVNTRRGPGWRRPASSAAS